MSRTVVAEPATVADLRAAARARFEQTGFPHPRDERWRHSDLKALTKTREPCEPGTVTAADLEALRLPDTTRLVVVDGVFQAGLSDEVEGVEAGSLAAALDRSDVQAALGRIDEPDPFSDHNAMHFTDGALVVVPDGTVAPDLHVLFVRTGARGVAFSRLLVLAGTQGELRLVEHHVGLDGPHHGATTNHVTEVVAGPSAVVHLDAIQQVPEDLVHVATTDLRQQRAAQVHHVHVALGAAHARNGLVARLLGPGADVELDGLYVVRGKQHSDHWTRVDHAVPHCASRQRYKGILDDESRGAFTGNVLVQPGAQKTSSQQENRNLLLSRKALCDATPQLEIHADDVRCSHGSTVGQLDRDHLFFLRSRGIDLARATQMLTEAFAAEVTESLLPPSRERVQALLQDWFRSRP